MAEWLFEAGVGEDRAALVADGRIIELCIDRHDDRLKLGAVVAGRLSRSGDAASRPLLDLTDGRTLLLDRAPPGGTLGITLHAEVTREAIAEVGGVVKPPRGRITDAPPAPAPPLRDRLADAPVRDLSPYGPDLLEAAGWSEAMEAAASGILADGAAVLRIHPTPAMTLIDIDGTAPAADLAVAGAAAAARAIRLFGIGGSIGLDLPTLASKAERQAAAAALDAVLPLPFERTGVNGFGFLQVVRRRTGPSLLERVRQDRALTAALALLRRVEREGGAGERTIAAHPAVIARIAPDWVAQVERRVGAALVLRPVEGLAISAGHVAARHPR